MIKWVILFLSISQVAVCKTRQPAIVPELAPYQEESVLVKYVDLKINDSSLGELNAIQNSSKEGNVKSQELNNYSGKFLMDFADKNVLQKNLNQIKKSSPAIQQMSDSVEQAGKVEAKTEYFQFGSNADLIHGQAKVWVDTEMFNTEAKLEGQGMNWMVYRQFSFENIEFLPQFRTAISLTPDQELVSQINTRLLVFDVVAQHHLNKAREFNMVFNYGINF